MAHTVLGVGHIRIPQREAGSAPVRRLGTAP